MSEKIYNAPNRGSDYLLHRVVSGVDSSDDTIRAHGMNMHGFRFANIQIFPDNGANPDVEVMFWCEEAGKFIPAHTALAFSGLGDDIPYEFIVEANGRIIWVKVTAMLAGDSKIYISGWEEEYR